MLDQKHKLEYVVEDAQFLADNFVPFHEAALRIFPEITDPVAASKKLHDRLKNKHKDIIQQLRMISEYHGYDLKGDQIRKW